MNNNRKDVTTELLESLMTLQVKEASRFFSSELKEVLKSDHTFLCGGSLIDIIDNKEIKDYDIFFTNKYAREGLLQKYKHRPMLVTDNATTMVSSKIQLINNQDSNIESILRSFDFTAVQIAFDGKDVYFGETTVLDLQNKMLCLHNVTQPFKSLRRLAKFAARGYDVNAAYQTIIETLAKRSPYELVTEQYM